MADFEYFIAKGDVKRQTKNEILAKALLRGSADRLSFIKRLGLSEENAKYIVENSYDVIRELIEARLSIDGFKSYSHEATILFLKKFPEFKESEISFIDNLRKIRNGIKYYGKEAHVNEAKTALNFLNSVLLRLKKLSQS